VSRWICDGDPGGESDYFEPSEPSAAGADA